jgi:hypothetical protein
VSTDLLQAPDRGHPAPEPPKPKRKKKRRRRFSLNGLAIQLSAFALSFTLVALLVVSGSQAAFVEENEAVTDYVPIGTTAPPEDDDPDRSPRTPSPSPPSRSPSSPAAPTDPPAEEPRPEEVPSTVVELVDSDAGTAMFGHEVTLAPGMASDRCIEVAYDGNVDPQPVRLYAAAATGDLSPYLDLTIEIGAAAAGSFGNCDGFVASSALYRGTLADFATRHDSWSTGVATWDPGPDAEARTFRFTVSVQDDPVAEGRSVVFGFSWETRDAA